MGKEKSLRKLDSSTVKVVESAVSAVSFTASAASGDADTVDGYHASATPTAGYLLPLDADGKFPATVLPTGTTQAQYLTLAAADALTSERILTPGAGLTGTDAGAGSTYTLAVIAADTSITVNADSIAVALAATSGLQISSGVMVADTIAGAGLTISSKVLAVGAGLGITVNANDVALASSAAGAGLTYTNGVLDVISGNTGIVVTADAITLTLAATSGLAISSGLMLDDAIAGAGLTISSKVLAVGAGLGITVNADDVALTTPGTLTVSTTNSSTGNHTHAVTASSAPGAASALLKSDASGGIQLDTNLLYVDAANNRVGIKVAPTSILHVVGDIVATGSLSVSRDATGIYLYDTGTAGVIAALFTGTTARPILIEGQTVDFYSGNTYIYQGQIDASGNLVLGGTGGAAKLHVLSATEQLRLAYNGTIFAQHTVASNGVYTIATTGGASNNLLLAPGGDLLLDPVGNDVLPVLNYDINLGSPVKKWLSIHAAELWIETLVAEDVISTIGGRILVTPTTTLTRDMASGDTTIYVKHNQMAAGDIIIMQRANLTGFGAGVPLAQIEFVEITSSATTITGTPPNTEYSYTVTRNLDGTGANTWYAGDALANTGQTGNGFHDLYSNWSVKGSPLDYAYNHDESAGTFSDNFALASRWTLFTAAPALNDAIYFGMDGGTWENLYFYLTTAEASNTIHTWEFWNGVAWTSFVPTSQGFAGTGTRNVTWTKTDLVNWASTTVNSQSAFWVRVRISTFVTWTTNAIQAQRRVIRQRRQWGPAHVIWHRNSSTFNDFTERAAFGNLDGLYDYSAAAFGVAMGRYAATYPWIAVDDTNGLRIMRYNTQLGQWDTSGNITIGQVAASQSNVYLTAGAIDLRVNTTAKLRLTTGGTVLIGENVPSAYVTAMGELNSYYDYIASTFGIAIGWYAVNYPWIAVDNVSGIRIMRYTTQLGQWDTSGNITIGEVAANKGNVYISSGQIALRVNASNRITLSTGGVITFYDGGGVIRLQLDNAGEVIFYDASIQARLWLSAAGVVTLRDSAGVARVTLGSSGTLTINDSGGAAVFTFNASVGAEFTKPLTLGTAGGIFQGTGTFASPTTGLKIWNDTGIGRIAGYNTSVLQWYANTDGKLYAGAGKVLLDATGVTLEAPVSILTTAATTDVKWIYSSVKYGKVEGDRAGIVSVFAFSNTNPEIRLETYYNPASPTYRGGLSVWASSTAGACWVLDSASAYVIYIGTHGTYLGRVGIGTSSPGNTLDVLGSSRLRTATGGGAFDIGDRTVLNYGNQYQYINYGGGTAGDDGWQLGKADNSAGIAPSKGFYLYDLKNSATRLVVSTAGYVGIGTIAPSYQLELSTDSAAKPTTNTWTVPSDSRLKKNVKAFADGLDVLRQVNPITYEHNGKWKTKDGTTGIGVLADTLDQVVPYCVGKVKGRLNADDVTDTDLYSFNTHGLFYVMLNAIKELANEVDRLKRVVVP